MANLLHKADDLIETVEEMAHNYKMSEMESRTRSKQNFEATEAKLPDLRTSPASDDRPSLSQDLLSHLGAYNPLAKQITDNDTVWLLDNTAVRNEKTREWQAEFVAAVFNKDTGLEVSTVVADIAEKVGIGKGKEQEERIKERLMPFMQSILPRRIVNIDFDGVKALTLGPGGRNGISSDIKKVPNFYKNGNIVHSSAKVPKGTNGLLQMETVFAEPDGWGLISDIDDTIKITQTSDPIGILRSTFVSDATPVEGMPELYTFIQDLTKTAPFFYLSASPYNLYAFLCSFRQQFYPQGTMILRDASWRNLSGLLSNLTLGTQAYKVDRMIKINSWLPKRKMICIGDSTQSDPEAYSEIYNKFSGWVRLILIRKVTDIAAVGIEEKNEPGRFEKAFKSVPKDLWHVFESPEECYDIIENAIVHHS